MISAMAVALVLAMLPSGCMAADEQWDDAYYAEGDGTYYDETEAGAGGGSYAEDAMAHEQYSERLQQQLESLRKEHDVGP